MEKKELLEKLSVELTDLKRLNPAHCFGTTGFIDHPMTPERFQKIEDIEEEIKKLKKDLEIK